MIVIIGFAVLLVAVFRYHYFRISDPECRKNTKDGVTYKDAFGHLRLLRDGRRVEYKKDDNGHIRLFYDNDFAVNPIENAKDAARFKGEKDYLCGKWGTNGYVFEIFGTGERYLKSVINGKEYYLQFGNNSPLKIVREVNWNSNNDNKGVDIDEFNKILEEYFADDPEFYGKFNYVDQAFRWYEQEKRVAKQKQEMQKRTSEYKRLKEETDYLWQRWLGEETKKKMGLVGEKYEKPTIKYVKENKKVAKESK